MEKNKKTLWLLEDDPVIQMLVSAFLLKFMDFNFSLQTVSSAKEVLAKDGDIILSDQHGVDLEFLEINNAILITMSSDKKLKVDLYKPFTMRELKNVLEKKSTFLKKAS